MIEKAEVDEAEKEEQRLAQEQEVQLGTDYSSTRFGSNKMLLHSTHPRS